MTRGRARRRPPPSPFGALAAHGTSLYDGRMATTFPAPGERILRSWRRLAPLPGGRALFSRLIGRMAPYSGSIGARVEALAPGYCRARLRDRGRLRNHLGSIHAVALTNLGELASGLAMLAGLPGSVRGIAVRLDSRYLKKARGRLVAECRCTVPDRVEGPTDHEIEARIVDREGDVVATVRATWRLDAAR